MISVWNYSNAPQNATLILYFNGGQYRIPVHLEARKSYNLDMMTLVRSRVPDADGNLIPANITSGSAELWAPDGELGKMNVVVSTSAYNVRNGTCWPVCMNCGGLTSLYFGPNTVIVPINGSNQATAYYTTSSGGPSSMGSGGSWSASPTSIATINNTGTTYGHAIGTASLLAEMSAPLGETECYFSAQTICEDQAFEGTGDAPAEKQAIVMVYGQGNYPYGQDPGITASVYDSGPPPEPGPTGTVTFSMSPTGGVKSATPPINSGFAYWTPSTPLTELPVNAYVVTAVYNGMLLTHKPLASATLPLTRLQPKRQLSPTALKAV